MTILVDVMNGYYYNRMTRLEVHLLAMYHYVEEDDDATLVLGGMVDSSIDDKVGNESCPCDN
jgi:hypothetical protein